MRWCWGPAHNSTQRAIRIRSTLDNARSAGGAALGSDSHRHTITLEYSNYHHYRRFIRRGSVGRYNAQHPSSSTSDILLRPLVERSRCHGVGGWLQQRENFRSWVYHQTWSASLLRYLARLSKIKEAQIWHPCFLEVLQCTSKVGRTSSRYNSVAKRAQLHSRRFVLVAQCSRIRY